jgi:putative endonuclease
VAARHLVEAGMVVLARNWRCRDGELDIVARDGSALVFVEVKTRRGASFGAPAEAIDAAKVSRLRRLAAEWITASGMRAPAMRFDVLSVRPQASGAAQVEHVRNAF